MASIKIVIEKCIGCKLCVGACPFNAITVEDKKACILDNCTLCGACVSSCKFEAIDLVKDAVVETVNLDDYRGVWVFAEQRDGIPAGVAFELLGEGRKLADSLGVELSAVLLGENVEASAQSLVYRGADNVYVVDNASLKVFNDETYSDVFVQLAKQYKPEIILIGASAYGRSLAPRISSRLGTGLTADCTELEIDLEKRQILQTRPAFGGNLMATIVCPNHRPQMSTVRPKVMKPLEENLNRTGKVLKPQVTVTVAKNQNVLDVITNICETVNITEADVIVSIGRGIGDPKNIKVVEDFARTIGAAVGASRAVVDAGWVDYSQQVGQTGKTVCPKVYFACGISGAVQHIAGMSSSDMIIAINKNPDAPIFKIATYGIVGDLVEVVSALTKEFKQRLG